MAVKIGDLIKFKGHICKVRYIDDRLVDNIKIEFDTPNHREFESIHNVEFPPFKNDNDYAEFKAY